MAEAERAARSADPKPRARKKSEPGAPRQLNFLETFVDKYFMSMPEWVRVVVYLLLVLTLINTTLVPITLEGQLLIEDVQGVRHRGKDYAIQTGSYQFWTNASGMWMLQTRRRLPGSIKASVFRGDENLGEVDLPLPLPIYSAIVDQPLVIVYSERARAVRRIAAVQLDLVATAEADPQQVTPAPPTPPGDHLQLGIRTFTVKDNGSQSVGKIYLKVYVNGRLIETPRLPQKKFPNTYLAIQDHTTNSFDDLFFTLPPLRGRPSQVRIDVYEDDSGPGIFSFFGTDERIGSFTFKVVADDTGKERWLTSAPVETGGPGNSSLLIAIDRAAH
jgi:hypothetical protein